MVCVTFQVRLLVCGSQPAVDPDVCGRTGPASVVGPRGRYRGAELSVRAEEELCSAEAASGGPSWGDTGWDVLEGHQRPQKL